MPVESLKFTQVDSLPKKDEQGTLFEIQPAQFVLHPERKVLQSS